jgi:hypothetical protein
MVALAASAAVQTGRRLQVVARRVQRTNSPITDVLISEEKVDRAARAKSCTQKKAISEGSEEWERPGIEIGGR